MNTVQVVSTVNLLLKGSNRSKILSQTSNQIKLLVNYKIFEQEEQLTRIILKGHKQSFMSRLLKITQETNSTHQA